MRKLIELQKQYGIAITGGIACGKSTVATILKNLGLIVIDSDHLARKALEIGSKGLTAVCSTFGKSILNQNGTLNRKLMRSIIINDAKKRKVLESIVHPIIEELLYEELQSHQIHSNPTFWFYEIPLLFETNNQAKFKYIWTITCDEDEQISRIVKRDNQSELEARKIINCQMSLFYKAKNADFVLNTNSSLENLKTKIALSLHNYGICQLNPSKK